MTHDGIPWYIKAVVGISCLLMGFIIGVTWKPGNTELLRQECLAKGGDRFGVVNNVAICTRVPLARTPKKIFEKELR